MENKVASDKSGAAGYDNCHNLTSFSCFPGTGFEWPKDHRSLYPVLYTMGFLEHNVFFDCNVLYIYCRSCSHALFCKLFRYLFCKTSCHEQKPVRSGEYPHTCRPIHPSDTGRTGSSSSAHKPSKPLPWRSNRLSRRFPPGRQSFCADGFQQSLQSW